MEAGKVSAWQDSNRQDEHKIQSRRAQAGCGQGQARRRARWKGHRQGGARQEKTDDKIGTDRSGQAG